MFDDVRIALVLRTALFEMRHSVVKHAGNREGNFENTEFPFLILTALKTIVRLSRNFACESCSGRFFFRRNEKENILLAAYELIKRNGHLKFFSQR